MFERSRTVALKVQLTLDWC